MEWPTSAIYEETLSYLKKQLPTEALQPKIAIICGSGLSTLAEAVENSPEFLASLDYTDIPHFLQSTVDGHAGKLVLGRIHGKLVALMSGRSHYYEGYSVERITYPIRVLKLLGVRTFVVTNAAGGLNPEYGVGDIVLLNDHIFLAGLAGNHPLRGPNMDSFGPRFPPLSDAYDLGLRRAAHAAWKKSHTKGSTRRLHEGVYAYVGGPSYETRAECRMLRQLGADVVGMSTVPEIVVARHCGLKILAFSLVTNKSVLEAGPRGDDALLEGATEEDLTTIIERGRASHQEVVEAGDLAALDVQVCVWDLIRATVDEFTDFEENLVSQIVQDAL